jgi:hypothetical protein
MQISAYSLCLLAVGGLAGCVQSETPFHDAPYLVIYRVAMRSDHLPAKEIDLSNATGYSPAAFLKENILRAGDLGVWESRLIAGDYVSMIIPWLNEQDRDAHCQWLVRIDSSLFYIRYLDLDGVKEVRLDKSVKR